MQNGEFEYGAITKKIWDFCTTGISTLRREETIFHWKNFSVGTKFSIETTTEAIKLMNVKRKGFANRDGSKILSSFVIFSRLFEITAKAPKYFFWSEFSSLKVKRSIKTSKEEIQISSQGTKVKLFQRNTSVQSYGVRLRPWCKESIQGIPKKREFDCDEDSNLVAHFWMWFRLSDVRTRA